MEGSSTIFIFGVVNYHEESHILFGKFIHGCTNNTVHGRFGVAGTILCVLGFRVLRNMGKSTSRHLVQYGRFV